MNKKQSAEIFAQALSAFGLKTTMQTDPRTLQRLMREYRLDHFHTNNEAMKEFFKECASRPQSLKAMFASVKHGVLTQHPAFIEFAEIALKKRWFRQSRYVKEVVHRMYLLEAITAAMINSHTFFVELQDHYKNEEKKCGIDPLHTLKTFLRSLQITHSLFGTMKALSVDPLMLYFRLSRGLTGSHVPPGAAKRLLKNKNINAIEYRQLSPLAKGEIEHCLDLIRMNIYEAGITEYKNGLGDNAFCAHFLSESILRNPPQTIMHKGPVLPMHPKDPLYKKIVTKGNTVPIFAFDKEWTSLYQTWNMTFMIHDCDDLDLIIAKLLIPSVIDAKHENYLSTRIIALWLTLNHGLFRRVAKKKVPTSKRAHAMAKAWAAINKKCALQSSLAETRETPAELMTGYRSFFLHPLFHFFGLLKRLY